MKFLGIDFGTKRVGIAISDEDANMAFPKTVLENNNALLESIVNLCVTEKVAGIVIGESNKLSGEPNLLMVDIEKFKTALGQKIAVEIFLEPEFFSSAEAERLQGKNDMLDASAAAIILKSFLDKRKNHDNH